MSYIQCMDEEGIKINIEGVEYHRLEDVPAQYRELIQKQLEAANSTAEAAAHDAAQNAGKGGMNVRINKHFDFKVNIKRKEPSSAPTGQPCCEASDTDSMRLRLVILLLIAAGFIAWKIYTHR